MSDNFAQRVAFAQAQATADASSRCLLEAFSWFGQPKSMLDIGCGDGHLVALAASLGIDAYGIDLYAPVGDRTAPYDLTKPWYSRTADLVICWEVAEHLHALHAETLCDTIADAVEEGGRLLFTAAIPGQGGSGHYNEQPHGYWRHRLVSRGLEWDEPLSTILKELWSKSSPEAWWYGQNIQVFSR